MTLKVITQQEQLLERGALPPGGFRNRLINGDFAVDQRWASGGLVVTSSGYPMDRWIHHCVGGGQLIGYNEPDAFYPGQFRCRPYVGTADASIAAGDYYMVMQRVEGVICRDLLWGTASARPVTLSFEVEGTQAGTFSVGILNSVVDRTWLGLVTINQANTRERKVLTIPGDVVGTWLTTNGVGLQLLFALVAGTQFQGAAGWQAGIFFALASQTNWMATVGNMIRLRDVQLEVGAVATEFERVPFDIQLRRCQRYYEKSYNLAMIQGAAAAHAGSRSAVATASNTLSGGFPWGVRKRAAPSVALWSLNGASGSWTNISGADLGVTAAWFGESGMGLMTGAGFSVGAHYAGHWVADAEL